MLTLGRALKTLTLIAVSIVGVAQGYIVGRSHLSASVAVADEGEAVTAPGIIVNIRVVKALGEIQEDGSAGVGGSAEKSPPGIIQSVVANITAASQELAPAPEQKVEPALDDIGSKLRKLHYREFKLASSQDVAIPLMKKRVVYLSDGHTLTIRPQYVDGSKIGIWLRWVDEAGTRVLDTRMHFHEEETMLAGTELPSCSRSRNAAALKADAKGQLVDGGHAATVLAIRVQPAS